jgi:uncharacterized protein (TIGR03435 family)
MKTVLALSVAGIVFLGAGPNLAAQTPAAQTPAAQTPAAPAFEVASVKPSPPGDPSNPLSIIPMLSPQPGGRFTAANMPLWALIATAWELPDFRIVGGNKELMNTKYHITAKASSGITFGQKELLPMLKNLIVERFQLKFHFEPREMSLYDLVLARGDGRLGPELKPTKSDCSNVAELNAKRADALAKGDFASIMPKPGEFLPCAIAPNLAGGPANLSMHGDGQEIKVLVDLLSQFTGKYVRDKTGLTGRYDFDMKLDMQALMGLVQKLGINVPAAALSNLPQSDGSSVMTVLNEQLGLKLESTRGLVDVLVIDSVETPTAD